MQRDNYLPLAEAARIAGYSDKDGVRYLHKLAKKDLPSYYVQTGKIKKWYVDITSERFVKLLNRNVAQGVEPVDSSPWQFDWDLWEDMCRNGEQIVKRRCSKATVSEYKRYILNFMKEYPELNRDTLRAALRAYDNKEKQFPDQDFEPSKQWVYRSMMTVARYFEYKKYVGPEFVHELRFLKPQKSQRIPRRPFHTAETVVTVLDKLSKAVNKRGKRAFTYLDEALNRALITLAFTTGARSDEIANIRIRDIEYGSSRILLRGKGGKERKVGFCQEAKDALRDFWAERPDSTSEFFLLHSKAKPLTPDYVYRRLLRVAAYAHVDNFTPHSMRRSFTRWAIVDNGLDVGTVRDALGHSTLAMTNIYLNTTENDVVSAMKSLRVSTRK